VIVQCDALVQSRLATAVCIPRTSKLEWAQASGNVLLQEDLSRLPKDSVALVSQIVTLHKTPLT